MMSIAVILTGAFIICPAENLVKNGDFERGDAGWHGDFNLEIMTDGGAANKVLAVEVDNKDNRSFEYQKSLKVKGLKAVRVSFRVRTSEDYVDATGRGVSLVLERDNTYFDQVFPIQPSLAWKYCYWDFDAIDESKTLELEMLIKPGRGTLYFDDITLTELAEKQ